jgi:hypothetical protein
LGDFRRTPNARQNSGATCDGDVDGPDGRCILHGVGVDAEVATFRGRSRPNDAASRIHTMTVTRFKITFERGDVTGPILIPFRATVRQRVVGAGPHENTTAKARGERLRVPVASCASSPLLQSQQERSRHRETKATCRESPCGRRIGVRMWVAAAALP